MATLDQAQKLNVNKVAQGPISWIDVRTPSLAEMEYLKRDYDFHPLALDDCLSRIQLPKVDEYEDYLFLVLHFPLFNKEARLTVPSQVSVFVSGDYVVTVHRGDLSPLTKLFSDCDASEGVREAVMGHSTGYLLYRILDGLVDYCRPIMNRLIEAVDNLEVRVFDMAAKELAREISVVKGGHIGLQAYCSPPDPGAGAFGKKGVPLSQGRPRRVLWGSGRPHAPDIGGSWRI